MSVVAQYAPDRTRQAWYTQSLARIDEVLSVVNAQGKFWYQSDALGSTYAMANGAGAVVARGGYDVFGASVAISGNVGQPFGFTGREHERDSGLVYARARYLNPSTGRWDRPDPLGMVDGPNRYGYVNAQPTLMVDPTGLVGTLPCRCVLSPLSQLYWDLQAEFGDPKHHLARVIYAEVANENDATMLGVGQVVMNRAESGDARSWRHAPVESDSAFAEVVSSENGRQFNAYRHKGLWIEPDDAYGYLEQGNCDAFNRSIVAAMNVMLGRGVQLLWPPTVLAFAVPPTVPKMAAKYWVTRDIGTLGGKTRFYIVEAKK